MRQSGRKYSPGRGSGGDPGPGQVRIEHSAVGLNYIDVYQRTGLYPLASMPQTLGHGLCGCGGGCGDGFKTLMPGDRVAYAMNLGAYSEAADRCCGAGQITR